MFERIPASDREAWLKLRGRDITASIAGALLGVHEYTTAYEQWGLKTGRIKDDPEETPAMRRGTLLEPVAVQILREEHPDWEIFHNTGPDRQYARDTEARVGATPDLFVMDPKRGLGGIQIKTVEQSIFRKKWMTPEREVEPPLWVAIQGLVEAHLCAWDWVDVAAMTVGFGIDVHLVPIPQKPKIIDMVYEKTAEFWSLIERGEEMSPDFAADGDAISAMYLADDGSEIDLSGNKRADEIRLARAGLQSVIKKGEEAKKTLDAEMKNILGNHACGVFADGKRVSWKTVNRKGYAVDPTTFRQMRYPQE